MASLIRRMAQVVLQHPGQLKALVAQLEGPPPADVDHQRRAGAGRDDPGGTSSSPPSGAPGSTSPGATFSRQSRRAQPKGSSRPPRPCDRLVHVGQVDDHAGRLAVDLGEPDEAGVDHRLQRLGQSAGLRLGRGREAPVLRTRRRSGSRSGWRPRRRSASCPTGAGFTPSGQAAPDAASAPARADRRWSGTDRRSTSLALA